MVVFIFFRIHKIHYVYICVVMCCTEFLNDTVLIVIDHICKYSKSHILISMLRCWRNQCCLGAFNHCLKPHKYKSQLLGFGSFSLCTYKAAMSHKRSLVEKSKQWPIGCTEMQRVQMCVGYSEAGLLKFVILGIS